MVTRDLELEHAKTRRKNERLDLRLKDVGAVDPKLFLDFASVESDPNASSVGWLNAKLQVLASRVSEGKELSLFEPAERKQITVKTVAELAAWADRHFSVVRFKP